MKWATLEYRREQKYEKVRKWHRWFAWRPICLKQYCYWLVFIERRADPILWRQRKEIQYWYRDT